MKPLKIQGVIVPLLTPIANDTVDQEGLARLIDFVIEHGVTGLFPLGTTGEGPLFTADERKRVAEWTVKHTAGRVPVIIHTGMITTAETIALTRHARDAGAVGLSQPSRARLGPPYRAAGLQLREVTPLDRAALAGIGGTWAGRLAHGRPRAAWRVEGYAT